jgi:hypothetical protein
MAAKENVIATSADSPKTNKGNRVFIFLSSWHSPATIDLDSSCCR